MNKDELWKIFTKKNPNWLTNGANLTPAGLKKLFDTTFDQGHELGVKNGKALQQRYAWKDNAKSNPFSDLFDGLGKK